MNSKIGFFAGTIGAVFGLACSVGVAAYVSDTFEAQGIGAAPSSGNGWSAAGSVIISNQVAHAGGSGSQSLFVPVLSGVTNQIVVSTNNGQVWTDFYTKPVRLSTAAPAVDTNATAQVFVNSNGIWCTLSGRGDGETVYTNIWPTILTGAGVYPTVAVVSAWSHVSVLHDYAASRKQWSLFVDDKLLATNLGFIAAGTASITNYGWFQVQNLGGDPSNVVWVDDFTVTNKIPTVDLAATNAVGATNGIPPAYALNYFGVMGDPRPVSTNFGLATNIGVNAISLQFRAQPNQQYRLIGGVSPVSGMTPIPGGTVTVDANGVSNFVADANALTSGSMYFYKILTVSPVDGSVSMTNAETFAWYKQDRSTLNSWYYSGAPVIYGSSSDNSLAGAAGQQLAMGLHGDFSGNGPDLLAVGSDMFFLNNLGVWVDMAGLTPASAVHLTPGMGVQIKRQIGISAVNYSVVSGTWTNTITPVTLQVGWNSLAWPYDTVATAAKCGFPNTANDRFVVMRAGNAPTPGFYRSGAWKTALNGTIAVGNWPQPGEGFLYYNAALTTKTWAPTR